MNQKPDFSFIGNCLKQRIAGVSTLKHVSFLARVSPWQFEYLNHNLSLIRGHLNVLRIGKTYVHVIVARSLLLAKLKI